MGTVKFQVPIANLQIFAIRSGSISSRSTIEIRATCLKILMERSGNPILDVNLNSIYG